MASENGFPGELKDILACPVCKKALTSNKEKNALICLQCSSEYPIKDGIPLLLPDK